MKNILVKSDIMGGVLFDVQQERMRQDRLLQQGKFPWSCDNTQIPDVSKLAVLAEEFGEAAKEASQIQEERDRYQAHEFGGAELQLRLKNRRARLRCELVQVAAVAVAWAESLDRLLDTQELAAQAESAAEPWCTECGGVRTPHGVCTKCVLYRTRVPTAEKA